MRRILKVVSGRTRKQNADCECGLDATDQRVTLRQGQGTHIEIRERAERIVASLSEEVSVLQQSLNDESAAAGIVKGELACAEHDRHQEHIEIIHSRHAFEQLEHKSLETRKNWEADFDECYGALELESAVAREREADCQSLAHTASMEELTNARHKEDIRRLEEILSWKSSTMTERDLELGELLTERAEAKSEFAHLEEFMERMRSQNTILQSRVNKLQDRDSEDNLTRGGEMFGTSLDFESQAPQHELVESELRSEVASALAEANKWHASCEKKAAEANALHEWRSWLRGKLETQEALVSDLRAELVEAQSGHTARDAVLLECLTEGSRLRSESHRLSEQLESEQAEAKTLRATCRDTHLKLNAAESEGRACQMSLRAEQFEVEESKEALAQATHEIEFLRASVEEKVLEAHTIRLESGMRMSLPTLSAEDLMQMTGNFLLRLGTGSFGDVFRGTISGHAPGRLGSQSSLGSGMDVAVKIPSGSLDVAEEQFLREVRVGSIRDQHIVPLVAVCVERRALVYPLAWGSLEDRLRMAQRPEPVESVEFLLGVAQGVAALHVRGLVHRDVKSANILLFPEQGSVHRACLGDCGWVCDLPGGYGAASTAAAVGTAPYLDPSAEATGRCTMGSDIFSLGVVLLEVLTRRSVTEMRKAARPMWHQLNDALVAASDGVAALVAAATAFIRGAGASDMWRAHALELAASITMESLRHNAQIPHSIIRPTAGAIVQCLEDILDAQALAPTSPSIPEPHERACTICFEEPVNVRFRPCCHCVVCLACVESCRWTTCPVCRSAIDNIDVGVFASTFAPA